MFKVNQISARNGQDSLNNVSFKVSSGEVLAVIGPNSCGKHLLGQVLAGQLELQSGTITLSHYRLDSQPIKAKSLLGYLPNPAGVEQFLSGYEFLDLIGSLYRIAPPERAERIKELIEKLDLAQNAYGILNRASAATTQKVALAAAVIHNPSCLVLDEPMQYLDFAGQEQLSALVTSAGQAGAAVVLVTDQLTTAEKLADRFLLLDQGLVLMEGSIKELINQTRPQTNSLEGIYAKAYSL